MKGLPEMIITGGQSGADLGALRAGITLGFIPGVSLGGYMPKGFRTEYGDRVWMKARYGCQEHSSRDYQPRTRANVQWADQTLIFGNVESPSSQLTLHACQDAKKPYWVNPPRDILESLGWGIVNVAGNRESGNRGIEAYVHWYLSVAWGSQACWRRQ